MQQWCQNYYNHNWQIDTLRQSDMGTPNLNADLYTQATLFSCQPNTTKWDDISSILEHGL